MRNINFSRVVTPLGKYQPRMRGVKLANKKTGISAVGAKNNNNDTLMQLTGCASELSCHAEDYRRYSEALKNYAEVYRDYQAYLEPNDPVAEHDYALVVEETEEHVQLGLLGDEVEQSVRSHVRFSDEEIEQFGYLGWLQH